MVPGQSHIKLSHYAKKGKSKGRIRNRLKHGACSCSNNCASKLKYQQLFLICQLFWNISKTMQDALLWSLASAKHRFQKNRGSDESSSPGRPRKRRTWWLDNIKVCRSAFCSLLGIGRKRLERVTKTFRGTDGRTMPGSVCKHVSPPRFLCSGITRGQV